MANDRIHFTIIHLKSKTNKEENFDTTVGIRNLMKNDRTTSRVEKRELEQSLMQEQNPLKNVLTDTKKDLELNQIFFLDNNVDHEKIIPRKEMKKSRNRNSKNYSPTKVKVQNFLTNITYNRLKNVDFNNASFIIDCYTYILFKLNPFFLEQNVDDKND